MSDTPTWEVSLYVDGPVTVKRRVVTTQQKGFRVDDPFYSDIEITNIPSGLKATVTARAPDHVIAYTAAVYFFGHMLDALTLAVNRPMDLSLTERERPSAPRHDVKRIIEREEFEAAFHEAHSLRQGGPALLRSLGWYRKGLTTDDPLDKFLAFWNVIEIVAGKFYQSVLAIDQQRAKNGCKSQVWECFKTLWGAVRGVAGDRGTDRVDRRQLLGPPRRGPRRRLHRRPQGGGGGRAVARDRAGVVSLLGRLAYAVSRA